MAKTNPLGPGTINVSSNIPEELGQGVRRLALRSGMSVSAYVRWILQEAVDREMTFVSRPQIIAPRAVENRPVNGRAAEEHPADEAAVERESEVKERVRYRGKRYKK